MTNAHGPEPEPEGMTLAVWAVVAGIIALVVVLAWVLT